MSYDIPCIIRETCDGLTRVPIQDILFQRREVQCLGGITPESVHALTMQLHYLAQEDPKAGITMFINSPGGEVGAGLALYDVMQAVPCPVRTVCVSAASMAAVLFAAGNRREMLPHARVMIHDPLIPGGLGGSALKIDSISKDLMRTRETMADILARHTKHTLEEVYEKTRTDSYFDAGEAVAWGLADGIIEKL